MPGKIAQRHPRCERNDFREPGKNAAVSSDTGSKPEPDRKPGEFCAIWPQRRRPTRVLRVQSNEIPEGIRRPSSDTGMEAEAISISGEYCAYRWRRRPPTRVPCVDPAENPVRIRAVESARSARLVRVCGPARRIAPLPGFRPHSAGIRRQAGQRRVECPGGYPGVAMGGEAAPRRTLARNTLLRKPGFGAFSHRGLPRVRW
jgi:hypothetical protein